MKTRIVVIAAASLILSSVCYAQQFGPSRAEVAVTDVPTIDEIGEAGKAFKMLGQSNHSYACRVVNSEIDLDLSISVKSPTGADVLGSRADSVAETKFYLDGLSGSAQDNTDRSDLLFFSALNGPEETGDYEVTITKNSELGHSARAQVACYETTRVCDYNTIASNFNFLEILNLGSKTGAAKIVVVDVNGVKAESSPLAIFSPYRRTDVDIHSIAGESAFGKVYIQPINFVPFQARIAIPKVSTYDADGLSSSTACGVNEANFGLLLSL